jgi:hypothetical protein
MYTEPLYSIQNFVIAMGTTCMLSYIDIFSYIHVYLPFGQKNHFILFILIIFQILSFVENPFHQGQGEMSATQPKNTSEYMVKYLTCLKYVQQLSAISLQRNIVEIS